MFTNTKPTALDELSRKMLEQGHKDIQARRMVNEALGINDKSQLPREHLPDWNRRFEEARQSLTEGVESKPENLQELSKHTLDSYTVKAINSAIANVKKNPKKFDKRAAGAQLAAKKLALKEERPDDHLLPEEDEGKPGKNFKKIADKAAKEYGSKEAGLRVAGAIRKKVLNKEEKEYSFGEKAKGMIPVIHKGKTIGHIWHDGKEWNSEHSGTGMSWATDNKKDAAEIVVDHHSAWSINRKRSGIKEKSVNEENLQELSKDTLNSYLDKAGIDYGKKRLAASENKKYAKILKAFSSAKSHGAVAASYATAAKQDKIADKRMSGIKSAVRKLDKMNEHIQLAIKEALDKNAGIEASKVNKELKVGFNWTNGKGQIDSKKADSDAEISTPPKTPIETGSKSISPAVMESLINEMLSNSPELMYSDFIMESAFGDAFKSARQAGKTEFSFGGKSYNTRQKGETDAQWRANVGKNNVAPTPQSRPVAPDNNKTTDSPDVAIRPETNPASVAAKRTPGMEGPAQSVSGPSTPNVPSNSGPQRQPGMTGRISPASSVAIKPETNPASVAAKRTVGMEGPGQSTSGPSTPNNTPVQKAQPDNQAPPSLTGAIQKATSVPSSVPPPPVRDVGGPSNVRPQPNNIDVRSQVSNSINPPSDSGPAAGLQQALNLKTATQRKAGEMAASMNEEKREVSLIESILSKPKIDMGVSMFGNEVSM